MRLTFLGHAGVHIETAHGAILCDPWFHPAFFAAWVPFPDNAAVDVDALRAPRYLYISHPHDDHLDARFLRDHVSKDVVVILPDFPTDDLRRALKDLGFHEFLETHNGEALAVDGLRLLTNALVAPTDGAIGDSGLAVSDGTATVFNQNDSKPIDLDALEAFGPYDLHMAQFSGAIWYPMVYRLDAEAKKALGRRKRANQLARAARFVAEIGAAHFVPFAGPPGFLDEDLFHLNDFGDDDSNIFVDQRGALAYMHARGDDRGLLTVPGTVVDLDHSQCKVTHPASDDEVERPFVDKERYLREYQARLLPAINAEVAALPDHSLDIGAELKEWWEPLLAHADHTCAGVNGRVLIQSYDGPRHDDPVAGGPTPERSAPDSAIVVDFIDRRVDVWRGEVCRFRFFVPRPVLETCIARRDVDWVNSLFLSCRFEAERD